MMTKAQHEIASNRAASASRGALACAEYLERVGADVDGEILLSQARHLLVQAKWLESAAVESLRASGSTWQEIADLYGITRQGAQQRWGGVL